MAGQRRNVLARGNRLQFAGRLRQIEHRERAAAGKRAAHIAARFDADIAVAVEAEAREQALDHGLVVDRNDAQMVAGAIFHPLCQGDFDMARRAAIVLAGVFQFGGADQRHFLRPDPVGHGIAGDALRELDRIERLRDIAATALQIEAHFLAKLGHQTIEPVVELRVDIAARVQFFGRDNALRPERFQLGVDPARHGLKCRRPVAVSAAKYQIGDAAQIGRCGIGLVEPVDELRRIVGRHAVIRRAGDGDHAGIRQRAGKTVHFGQCDVEAAEFRALRQFPCKAFAGTEVRPEQHGHRRSVAGYRRGGARAVGGFIGACGNSAPLHILAQPRPHGEALRLDRERFLDLELVVGVIVKLEALQNHRQHQDRLLNGELAADAGALSVAERLVGRCRAGRFRLGAEMFGIEGIGIIAPDRRVAVERRDQDGRKRALGDRIFPAQHLVLVRSEAECRGRRPQAQSFRQDRADIGQPPDLRQGGRRIDIAPQHRVHLGIGALQNVAVFQQVIHREGQQPRCGLVAGNQEGVDLVADVFIRQPLARFRIAPRQHEIEEVARPVTALLAPLANDLVDQIVHVIRVDFQLPDLLPLQQLFARQAAHLLRRAQRAVERFDERMKVLAVERVEPVAEAAHPDRVQRQAHHVVGHVDHVACIHPLPFQHQLAGDVDHHRQVAAHRLLAEGGQQDIVRLRPVRILGIAGKQPVARNQAQAFERAAHGLVEALLVAHLRHQIRTGDEDEFVAHDLQLEDRAVFVRQLHQRLDHARGIDRQRIADQRLARRRRNRRKRCILPHRMRL